MLPPDTSSNVLPWRMMVPLMQLNGFFPYRMSATNAAPVFSLPLFLWSVFLQVFLIACSYMSYINVLQLYANPDVGTVVFLYSGAAMTSSVTLIPFVMMMKGDMLAALLHDMSQIKGVLPVSTHRWHRQAKALCFLFSVIMCVVFMSWFNYTIIGLNIYEILMILCGTAAYCVNFFLPETLFAVMLDFLSRRLMVATETTIVAVSPLLAPDGTFNRESAMEAAMVALRDLDVVFREVEEQWKKGTRCFFLVVTMLLLTSVLLAIACPYAILQGSLMGGITIGTMLFAYYIMGLYCYLGQTFVNQISTAERLLKDLRMKGQNPVFCMKVSHVLARLTPLLTFNMCGWYTLDYSSYLGLLNTVLTYVVIIFQIGGNSIAFLSSSSNTTLSQSAS